MVKVEELLAVNLKFNRVRLGFSQARIAELCDLPVAYIKELENGKRFPSAEKLERISEALGVKPYEMLYEGDEWEARDSRDNLAGLYLELTEKINTLLDETIHRRLGF
ncbi:MAG: helix-turn-helix transcriptional regulator [Spirochaetales bacterium]|nr:helix-turn-helix transcriptional regulator [Spirochaetales bacterium]